MAVGQCAFMAGVLVPSAPVCCRGCRASRIERALYAAFLHYSGEPVFLVPRWQKMPEKHQWQFSGGQAFLSLFALSGMLMSVVFALLLAMVW